MSMDNPVGTRHNTNKIFNHFRSISMGFFLFDMLIALLLVDIATQSTKDIPCREASWFNAG